MSNTANVDFRFKNKHDALNAEISKLNGTQKMQAAVYAIGTGQTPELKAILEHVQYIDAPVNGKTLLMVAAASNNLVATRMLIESFDADPAYIDIHDDTCLDIALSNGHSEIAEYLMTHGVKPRAQVAQEHKTVPFRKF